MSFDTEKETIDPSSIFMGTKDSNIALTLFSGTSGARLTKRFFKNEH